MAFGQQLGPPASSRQVQELLTLVRGAGHEDFRDARGPLGFTQRQAGGKFTRDEAAALIDQLSEVVAQTSTDTPGPAGVRPADDAAVEQVIRALPVEQLAAELRRRGWTVTEP